MDQSVNPPAAGKPPLTRRQLMLILVSLMLCTFLGALDQTIVTPALSAIGNEFGEFANLPWVFTAYLLAATAMTPLYGKLADIIGRRLMILAALGIFLAGSIACALAGSLLALIVARALQGLGGGGMMAMAVTIIGDIVAPKNRGRLQVFFSATWLLASLLGPVVGGVLAEKLHWSLIFWINVPIALIALALSYRQLRLVPRHERRHRLDLLGAALMAIATVSLLLAFSWGGRVHAWLSPTILSLLAVAAVGWAAFAYRLTVAPEPFIPLTIVRNRVILFAIGAGFFAYGGSMVLTVFAPLYFETVQGLSRSLAGAAMIPLMVGGVIGVTIAGQMMVRVKHYKIAVTIGLPLATATLLALALFPSTIPLWAILTLQFLFGIGFGTHIPNTIVAVQNASPLHQMGTSTGALLFARSLGSAALVTMLGAAFMFTLGLPPGGELSTEFIAGMSGEAAPERFAGAYRVLFLGIAACLVVAIACIAFLEEKPLSSKIGGDHPTD